MVEFEWDEEKARRNREKHGVSFEEAMAVFRDPFALDFLDLRHDYAEERTITVGLSSKGVLMVVSTERGERIRLISARRATKEEARAYADNRD
jgi:uncharacterized DUF497 family protein